MAVCSHGRLPRCLANPRGCVAATSGAIAAQPSGAFQAVHPNTYPVARPRTRAPYSGYVPI